MIDLDAFLDGYITCALWSSTDESTPSGGRPLDDTYTASDLAPDDKAHMRADCLKFLLANSDVLTEFAPLRGTPRGENTDACLGHDFWLTRNGHGTGFWDRGDYKDARTQELGKALTDASHKFGECHVYIGNDGRLYYFAG